MRRPLALLLAGFLAGLFACYLVLQWWKPSTPPVTSGASTSNPLHGKNEVMVSLKCSGTDGLTADVDTWTMNTGNSTTPIVWHLVAASHAQDMRIDASPRNTGPWPFSDALPYTITPGQPVSKGARSSNYHPGNPPLPTGYTITATALCKDAAGVNVSRKVVIDPDMIVF